MSRHCAALIQKDWCRLVGHDSFFFLDPDKLRWPFNLKQVKIGCRNSVFGSIHPENC